MERENPLKNLLSPSVMLLLVGMAGLFVSKVALQSPRPAEKRTWPVAEQRVEARLWQDPFASICLPDNVEKLAKAGSFAPPHAPQRKALLLSVVVNGGSYAENIESRLRTRYATVTALQRAGYVAADPERIGLARLERKPEGGRMEESFVAHEVFTRDPEKETKYETVVVTWLIERDFPEASKVEALPADLGWREKPAPEHAVIGPRSSNGLVSFLRGSRSDSADTPAPRWLSPWATISARKLLQEAGSTRGTNVLGLRRCIATDDELAQAAVDELRARLGERRAADLSVVLLAESDTEYGRALPEEFRRALTRNFHRAGGRLEVRQATYLRGVDGEAGDNNAASATPKPGGETAKSVATSEGEVAHGPRQLDYVRRLAHAIALEMSPRQRSNVAIAIGVLGSDVYDKLVLLDALRAELPGAIYFTTDLDARLAEPSNTERTQGLLVFSSFGLESLPLGGVESGENEAQFRDNYQSAVHAATLVAVKRVTMAEIQKAKQVGRYVIGRGTIQTIGQLEDGVLARWVYWWLGLATLLAVIRGWNRPHNAGADPDSVRRAVPGWLLALVILLGAAGVWLWWGAWPYFILLLALVAGWEWVGGSRFSELGEHAIAQLRSIFIFGLLWAVVYEWGCWRWQWDRHAMEPFSFTSGASAWPGEVLRALAVIVLAFSPKFFEFRLVDLHERLADKFHLAAPDKCPLRSWPEALVYAHRDVIGFFRQSDAERLSVLAAPLATVWCRYIVNGRVQSRMVRMAIYASIYMLGMLLLFDLFGWPDFPGSGAAWAASHWTLLIFAVFGMACTVGFVVDASRLSVEFLKGLRNPAVAMAGTGAESRVAQMVKIVRLAGEQTHTVGRLVYVPAVAWLFLVAARFSFFDRADWPWSFTLPLIVVGWVLVMRSVVLRNEAELLRESYLDELRFGAWPPAAESERAAEIITSFDRGAFAPLSQQPIVGAVLIPFGGAGVLELIQRYMM